MWPTWCHRFCLIFKNCPVGSASDGAGPHVLWLRAELQWLLCSKERRKVSGVIGVHLSNLPLGINKVFWFWLGEKCGPIKHFQHLLWVPVVHCIMEVAGVTVNYFVGWQRWHRKAPNHSKKALISCVWCLCQWGTSPLYITVLNPHYRDNTVYFNPHSYDIFLSIDSKWLQSATDALCFCLWKMNWLDFTQCKRLSKMVRNIL